MTAFFLCWYALCHHKKPDASVHALFGLLLQVMSWGIAGKVNTVVEQPVVAMTWQEEAAELYVQLNTFHLHDTELLPSSLVGLDLGFNEAAIANRYGCGI